MYFLPENSKRRADFIAGIAAAFLGLALVAFAEQASASPPTAGAQPAPSVGQAS